jgi:hypothetical protein
MKKKPVKRPLIERDVPPITPESIASEIGRLLSKAVGTDVQIHGYRLKLTGGATIEWEKPNGT